jgi:uncharacterized protein (DUF427 family)
MNSSMTLTVGSGPFGHAPAGEFNLEIPRERMLLFEPFARRMRATFAGEQVLDSSGGRLLYEHGVLPRCYFPRSDVRMDLLERTGEVSESALKGPTEHWRLRVGDREVAGAAISHPEPPEGAPALADYIALRWSAMDEWREEDEIAIGHVRDPYHRVDVLPSSRHVVVRIGDRVLAESRRAKVIYETALPPRWYFPAEDILVDLVRTDLETVCAYKGVASYWSVDAGGERRENIAWTYREPRHDAADVRDHVAFFAEHVEIVVDGEPAAPVRSPWSAPDWWKGHLAEEAEL